MSERMQLLKKSRRTAEQDSNEASRKNTQVYDKSASEHNLEVGDKMLFDNQLFVAKKKSFHQSGLDILRLQKSETNKMWK